MLDVSWSEIVHMLHPLMAISPVTLVDCRNQARKTKQVVILSYLADWG